MPPKPKNPTCPTDGRELIAVDLDSETPPWLCDGGGGGCSRGWWNSELAHQDKWDHVTRSFGKDHDLVLADALKERDQRRADKLKGGKP